MENKALQSLVQRISLEYFNKPFLHQAVFNNRLRTTGGRYMLQNHNIEISMKQFEAYGEEAIIDIIKHELVHYHLHIEGKGYKHRDRDFKQLAQQVGHLVFAILYQMYILNTFIHVKAVIMNSPERGVCRSINIAASVVGI